jgi:hypothetical protein
MRELTSATGIKIKGVLFLFLGLISSALLVYERLSIRNIVLLTIAIWSFCRFYYFAFYVQEHYVDPTFRFSGLWSLGVYLVRRKS